MKFIDLIKEKLFIYVIMSLYLLLLIGLVIINISHLNNKNNQVIELSNILTQDNIIISKNINGYVYYVNKNNIKDINAVKIFIKKYFNIEWDIIESNPYIIYLLHKQINKIEEKLPDGIIVINEKFRYYPYKDIFMHPVGLIDNNICFGLEAYNLKNHNKKDIITTLLFPMQYYLYEKGKEGLISYQGDKFHGIIQNEYGEIVAMVSLCRNSQNQIYTSTNNGIINNIFEFGSVIKLFTFSLGLHKNIINIEDTFNLSHGAKIGSYQITDVVYQKGFVNVLNIFKYSSNIGTLKIAEKILNYVVDFFSDLMLDEKVIFDFYKTTQPNFKKKVPEYALLSYCMGYSFSTGMLQVLRAFNCLFTDKLYNPSILKKDTHEILKTYKINNKAAIQQLLLSTSEATPILKKYNVMGKTGSARILKNKTYIKNVVNVYYICTFVKNNKRYFMLLVMENPRKGDLASGTIKLIGVKLIDIIMKSYI